MTATGDDTVGGDPNGDVSNVAAAHESESDQAAPAAARPAVLSRSSSTHDVPAYVGRYEIRQALDRGASALVVLAWDEELESLVALKILDRSDAGIEQRFLDEARMLRRVRAPNVITVHDIGRLADGRPYFVLNYADRGTLADRLPRPCQWSTAGSGAKREQQNLDELQALLMLVDALADGLSAIHAAGLVHRDIKPGNILFESVRRAAFSFASDRSATNSASTLISGVPVDLLVRVDTAVLMTPDERALVGDLGIAKDLSSLRSQPAFMGGTPLFIAPEQREPGAPVTPAADIYSATAVLWSVLTGCPPPLPLDLQRAMASLPVNWQEIIARGMHVQPVQRFQSMDEWRWAIHEVAGGTGRTVQLEPLQGANYGDICPYKGLAAYQPEDARFFCGREAMTDELLRRLQLNQVLVVGGPSGSGKSSLVRAGLVPALAAQGLPGSEKWQIAVLTPGVDPMRSLRVQLAAMDGPGRDAADAPADAPVDGLPDANRSGIPAHATGRRSGSVDCILVIDQFEELFTLAPANERKAFLETLAQLTVKVDTRYKIVIVVRADFYGECAREHWLASRISNNQVLVGPMTASELRQAISEPARRSGYFLEPGLVEAILEEAGSEAGALPLVAHSLVETWVRRDGNTLTLKGFHAAGGVAGAISQTADAAFEHQLDDAGREQTRRLMLRLVAPGKGSPDTRRVLPRSELDSSDPHNVIDEKVLQLLTEARLLSIDDDSIQIAHEALLHQWPRLHRWIEESRDDLRVRQKISRAASEWSAESQDTDLLYRGTPLLTAIEWQSRNSGQLNPLEEAFLDASTRHTHEQEVAEKLRETRAHQLRRNALVALSLLSIGTTVASFVAFQAFRDSQRNEALAADATEAAEARFAIALGAAALGHVEEDPRLALVLAAESMGRAYPHAAPFDSRAAMISARQTLEQGGPFLLGGPLVAGDALSIALNPQGSLLALASTDGAIDLIDTASREHVQPAAHDHNGGIRDVEFSPDGRQLASVGTDGTVRLWRPDYTGLWTSVQVAQTRDVIVDVDFMPDGQSVFTANDDGTVTRWYLDGRAAQPPPLAVADYGYNSIAISADGRYLLTANMDKNINGYSILTGEHVMGPVQSEHANHLVDISFSVDGSRFVTLDTDGNARMNEFPSGRPVQGWFDPQDPLGVLFFHPDAVRLIGGDAKGRLVEWDATSGKLLKTSAQGHSQTPLASSLSGDGRLLATLGRDQIVRFWTLGDHYPLATIWHSDSGPGKGISLSSNGNRLASADENGLVQIRSIDADDPPMDLGGHRAAVWALAFSPDDTLLASGDRDGKIRLWDASDGQLQQAISIDDALTGSEPVWSLAFVADGSVLLVGADQGVRRRDIRTQTWLEPWPVLAGPLTRLELSADRHTAIISYASGHVQLLDVDSGRQLLDLQADKDIVWSAALSIDGRMLASASGSESVSLFRVQDGTRIASLTGHSGGATNVRFLADGATLVASDRKGKLHWWDLATQRRLASPWQAHQRAIWRLVAHPDGSSVATAGDDGTFRLWNVLDAKRACAIGLPGFDASRRIQYLGNEQKLLGCDS